MPKAVPDELPSQPVLLDIDGPVAIVSNNRPEVHNAASDAFNRRLWEVFYELHLRDDIRCVIWRGNGKSFSSGRDLRELGGPRDGGMSHLQHIERGHRWTQMLFSCPAPIIVSLKGWVIGGMFERALKARRRKPMFVVDFAVPRDVEPEVATLEDVFLYTIDDLGNVVSEGRERRQSAVTEAEAIVEAQLRAFREWQGTRAAAPAIVELRRRADQYREAELAKARARLAKGEDPAAVLEGLARGLANKFLHHPSQALSRAAEGERETLARAIETLFPEAAEREPEES